MADEDLESPYEVLNLVGSGGMGQVFLAHHNGLDRKEALKVLAPKFARDPEFVSRLRREARAATRLNHRNIVSVYGFGKLPDGRYYLAMEYLEGKSLREVLRMGETPSQSRAHSYLHQLASAMAHAHKQSVVHRDLKPANLFIPDGVSPDLKVLDFGLAKIISPGYRDSLSASIAGSCFGTPGYLAPERLREPTSAPSVDVYSFGCIAYELLTGRLPFEGPPLDVLNAHQSRLPAQPSSFTTMNSQVEAMIMRCLEKSPASRYSDGQALLEALTKLPGFAQPSARLRRATMAPPNPEQRSASDTHRDSDQRHTLVDLGGIGFAHTEELGHLKAVGDYRLHLLRLAENLIATGCSDAGLVATVGTISHAEASVETLDKDLLALLNQGDSLHKRYRKQESVLRLALDDIRLDLAEGSQADPSAARAKGKQLTDKLKRAEAEYQEEARAIVDREVEVATKMHSYDGTLDGSYAELLQLADANLIDSELTPESHLLLENFTTARATLNSMHSRAC